MLVYVALLLTFCALVAAAVFLRLPVPSLSAPARPSLEVLYQGDNPEVDIIAVHGLGSNVDWTWVWRDGQQRQVHWLRDLDMLSAKVPRSRILAYNYVSRWHSNAPKTRLQILGESFITSLHEFRQDAHDRPIIFIGHSLGGLVVTFALTYAAREEQFKYLPRQVVGFVSLGCPFRGTEMQSMATLAVNTLRFAGSQTSLIKDLSLDNDMLRDRLREFSQLQRSLDLPMYCFFELFTTDCGKKAGVPNFIRGMIVEEASAAPEAWPSEGLNTDHFMMNKFTGPMDQSFLSVSRQVRLMFNNMGKVISQRSEQAFVAPFLVEFGRDEGFIGRESILDTLFKLIVPSLESKNCKQTVIEGLGGIGKTSIALEAAFKVREANPECSVFWVPAVDTNTFENAYRKIGQALKLPDIDDIKADVRVLVKTALDQFSTPWLLIIDNADDPNLMFGDPAFQKYFPNSYKGSILFTTRTHKVSVRLGIPLTNTVHVTELSRQEATKLLEGNLKEEQIQDHSTTALLDFLADLPLAIKQAAAYIYENDITTTRYLQHCISSDNTMIKLLSKDFYDRGRYDDIKNPIATTWLISFSYIMKNNLLASKYMMYMSLLAEKDIPKRLLVPMGDGFSDDIDMDDAVGTLKAYNFIWQRKDQDSYDIHRLVRLAMRNWLSHEGQLSTCIDFMIHVFEEAFPNPGYSNKDAWVELIPHCQELVQSAGSQSENTAYFDVLDKLSTGHFILGHHTNAERLFKEAVESKTACYGEEHPSILISKANLAAVYSQQGRWKEAEELEVQVLDIERRVLGEEHPETLTSKANLASTYYDQGRYKETEELQIQVLEISKKVLGEEHAQVLLRKTNLAATYTSQGRLKEGEELQLQVLETENRVLGEEHPNTLTTKSNLASTYKSQGRWKEAEELEIQTLEMRKKVLGEEHPHTLQIQSNLVLTYNNQGRWKEAEQLGLQSLEMTKKVFEKDHPVILQNKSSLASTYQRQGRWKEAEQVQHEVLESMNRVFGEEHPTTLTNKSNLAIIYQEQGQWKEAEELSVQVLQIRKRVFGEEHLETLIAKGNLAINYDQQGRQKEAEELEDQVLAMRKKILGEEHPHTLLSMANLASRYRGQGRLKEAEELQIQVLKMNKKLLGEEHPYTVHVKVFLAMIYSDQRRWEEAEQLEVQILDTRRRILGEEHPSTLNSKDNLAVTYRDQRRWRKAIELGVQTLETRVRVFGEEHPDTLVSKTHLGLAYHDQGLWKEAEKLQIQVLETRKRTIGEEHTDTVMSKAHLGLTYSKQGRWKAAGELESEILETRRKLLGKEHRDTLTTMTRLAHIRRSQGQNEEAISLMENCTQIKTHMLGPDHPDVRSAIAKLHAWRGSSGEKEKL